MAVQAQVFSHNIIWNDECWLTSADRCVLSKPLSVCWVLGDKAAELSNSSSLDPQLPNCVYCRATKYRRHNLNICIASALKLLHNAKSKLMPPTDGTRGYIQRRDRPFFVGFTSKLVLLFDLFLSRFSVVLITTRQSPAIGFLNCLEARLFNNVETVCSRHQYLG